MKILFICSSLEPGKDGVGDYTRKLAGALIKLGHKAAIIAINDRRLGQDSLQEMQWDNDIEISVSRLSSTVDWNLRLQQAKKFIEVFKPDWISLQYVPFGFHIKGLPFNLGKKLKQLADPGQWHVMFHELSVNRDESLKFRIWSFLQVKIIQSLLKDLRPTIVNTNTELYEYRLKEMGFKTTVLPLFSNISRAVVKNEAIFERIIPAFIAGHKEEYIIGTLFGSFDFKRWNMCSLLDKFTYSFNKKRIVIVSLGRMSSGQDCWYRLQYEYPQVIFLSLGEQSPEFISWWLSQYTDFGILTTLPELAGKSGSFMAFREHGIPVVCRERMPSLEAYDLAVDKGLIEVNAGTKFQLPVKQPPVSQLNSVAAEFMNELVSSRRSTVDSQQ